MTKSKAPDDAPKKIRKTKHDKSKKASKGKMPDITNLEQKNAELTSLLQRERADSENLRRRHNEQITELRTYVKSEVIKELLPAIDNLDRALSHVPKDLEDSDYVKGVQGIAKQFATTFKKLGVEKIATVGENFNPELHEAISMDDSAGGTQEVVSEELQSGYVVDGQVIRHAMVRVELK